MKPQVGAQYMDVGWNPKAKTQGSPEPREQAVGRNELNRF
jgi:hypothetical protein